jgi:DNA sulfur modification protein DndD
MKINSITINNFQSYYGEQTIEFGDGLNLIIGNGGKGKSKLFNAFYWVLFGKIYVTSEGWCTTDNLYQSSHKALHNYEYFNKKALSEAKVDGKISCSVQLELEDDKGNNYIIERQASTIRQPQSEWDKPESWSLPVASLKVTYDVPTGTKTVNGIIADGVVSDLFPEGIRGYIWFQGESLDSLINFRNRQNLKEAVRHISYYPFYEKLTAIIGEAKNKIAKQEVRKLTEVNKQNNEAKALLARIRMLRERIQIEEENKKKHQQNIEIIQVALADDESKMEGLAGFSNLISDYDNCEKEIIRLNNRLTELDTEQRRLLPSLWLLRGIDGMIEQSKQIISSHVEEESSLPEKKYIDEPSRIKLEEILNKDHRCFVCGSPVDEAHPHAVEWIMNRLKMQEEYYKELEDYRNNMEFSKQFNMFVGKIQDYPDYLLRSLKGIDKQFQDIADDEEKLMALRKKQHDKKNELEKKIEDVKRKYGVDPHKEASNVPRLTTSIKASRSNLEKEKKLLNSCISTIKEYNFHLEEAERNLGSSSGTSAITKVAETEWKNISIFLESICRDVQEKARKELISKIQIRANEFYDKFTEHDRGYKGRIEINDDYTISFDAGLNTSHEDRKKMSIINALLSLNQEAIGTYYPFISDAPTSSFDPSTTHKYLMGIKDIFHQTIIMTKDVEIGSDKYNDLIKQDKVSRVFQLDTQSYRSDSKKPEIWEVSTIVKSLK